MRLAFRILALISMIGLGGKIYAQVADPAPEPVLAYEGRLVESGTPVTGARSFVFSIVDSTGDELWNSGTQTLTVTGGLYGVALGATGMPVIPASLTLRANLSLRVNINGVQLSPDIALIPALQASVAWSVIGPFLGDVSGTQQTISVNKLQGTPINLTAPPSAGEVLTFDGTSWIAAATSGGAGSEGPAGPQGPQGVAGPAGPPGATGPMGLSGAPGAQGPSGAAGAAGANGNTVLNGAVDPTPAVGADGDFYINTTNSTIFGPRVADTWPAGVSLIGATGAQGPAGAAGATGAQGPAGAAGSAGPQGIQGIQGFVGPSGPQGPAGAAGTNGTGFDFLNAFNASASYVIDDVVTYNGSTYLAIAANSGPSNPTPDTNPSAWSVMAEEGAAGAAGAVGSTGSQGPQGIPGAGGATGATGPQGPAGASPFTLDGANAVFTTGSVGIGVDPPSSTAELDVTSTTKGLLAPRMTTAERLAIASPANGLIVYDTQLVSLEVYDAVGAVWNQLADTATTGSVTSVTASAPLTVTNGTTTPAIALSTVPVASGGTGATTLTGYLLGSGASAVTASATIPGTAISGNIAGTAANVSGTVAIANGGTGAASATAAITNLLPSQTGDSGKVLTTNGTAASWGAASVGTVTSVTGTLPITVATGTTTPAISLSTVPVASGGTGAVTASAALTNLLPSQTGDNAQVLTTNGTAASWAAVTTGTVTSVTGTSPITVATGTTTPAISLSTVPVASGGTGATTLSGYLFGNAANAVTATPTIPVANGGTGAITATAALTNLLPSQTGNSGTVLTTNGTATSWSATLNGTVTSVTGTSPIVVATGTTTPAISLSTVPVASGGTGATTLSGYVFGNAAGAFTATPTIPVANGGTGATTFTAGYLLLGNGTSAFGSAGLYWNASSSRLGVGTTSPSYPLDIESSQNATIGSYGYLAGGGAGSEGGTNAYFGLYVSARILTAEIDATSDARIKNIIGPSDIASDLETLEKLKITNYRYIDVVGHGNQPKKGVIAQEVEKVYPDAVRITSDFIPSVYAMADRVRYNDATHELTVTVPRAHGFAAGDMVRIITDAGNVDRIVASITDDHTFVLADVESAASKVFVFGKKVNDFHVVDYDQLFSMNIGATQQLAMQNQTLMKENAALKAENEAIEVRLAALERAVENLQGHK